MVEGKFFAEELLGFAKHLQLSECSSATISKYLHDVKHFCRFVGFQSLSKDLVLSYKAELLKHYAVSSANSMLAALNSFLQFVGRTDCCVRQFKLQKKTFSSAEKELSKAEYFRLVQTAEKQGKDRLCLILQTICATGIRVSELKYITVEAVRQGRAVVSCKNKTRTIFLVRDLQRKLLKYIKCQKMSSGCVFVTRSQRPVNRCNIWSEMKGLCNAAGVSPDKVFPHNLRHLFARIFYSMEKDIAKLADLLGHFSIDTTRIYIASCGIEHRRKMEQMRLLL